MKNSKSTILIFLALLLTTACKPDSELSELTFDDTSNTMEAATSAMTAVIEDDQGGTYAFENRPKSDQYLTPIFNELLPQAIASNECARPYFQSCESGVKSAIYNGCSVGTRGASYSGEATLSYSDSSCQMLSYGDYVVRTYDIVFTGPKGFTKINISSEPSQNYLGETHSGGGRLTKTATGYELEVLGRNQQVNFNGRLVASQSIKTTTPIQVVGGLARTSRLINGGELVVSRNLAKYKAKFTPNNVQYSNSCCHPVSGSLSITYEGSKTGSATLTFLGCGSAQYEKDDLKRDVTLSYCH